jgi:DNA (cytosine-5)-methyltransferase 1
MTAYYNEHDEFAAAWLRNLINACVIAPGDVDERSIEDVLPMELHKYTQVHLFAGIGVWSYAMRGAGWADDRAGWSCSCPCQPFSQAGQGNGFTDERHLWPAAFHLVAQCGPDSVLGEQVASPDGLAWLDLVQTDMEAIGYAFGALVTPAAGYGAPHIRHRTYWVAHRRDARSQGWQQSGDSAGQCPAWPSSLVSGVADATDAGFIRWRSSETCDGRVSTRIEPQRFRHVEHPGPTNGVWRDVDWLYCRDGRWRPVEPGTFPLVNGLANRVGLLRGYGNAIVAPQAIEFIKVALEYAP